MQRAARGPLLLCSALKVLKGRAPRSTGTFGGEATTNPECGQLNSLGNRVPSLGLRKPKKPRPGRGPVSPWRTHSLLWAPVVPLMSLCPSGVPLWVLPSLCHTEPPTGPAWAEVLLLLGMGCLYTSRPLPSPPCPLLSPPLLSPPPSHWSGLGRHRGRPPPQRREQRRKQET